MAHRRKPDAGRKSLAKIIHQFEPPNPHCQQRQRFFGPMASALTDRLSRLVKTIRGQARITEANVQDMLREVRMALLEADVALPVVRDFIARVEGQGAGPGGAGFAHARARRWWASCTASWPPPWARASADINLAAQPPAVILMAGLQGAGKTTTTAKLAKHLIEKRKKKVLTVSGDVYRPAAIEQLKTVTAAGRRRMVPQQRPTRSRVDIAWPRSTTRRKHYLRRAAGRHRRPPGH
jgi:signal recognition particle subunit SRP54